MVDRTKREPKGQAGSAALVELNLWDVLFGLMESAGAPAVPGADGRSAGDVPADAGTGDRSEPAEPVKAARRKAGREARGGTRRGGEAGLKT